jgi:hypothetical protein
MLIGVRSASGAGVFVRSAAMVGRGPFPALASSLGWLGLILAVCLAALWLWRAGQPGLAWAVAVTSFVLIPAALAGAAAARRDLRRAGPGTAAPAGPAVACTGRSGNLLALWDEDGRLVQECPAQAVGQRAG